MSVTSYADWIRSYERVWFFLAAIHIRSTGEYIQINVVITKKPLNGAIIEENVLFGTQK